MIKVKKFISVLIAVSLCMAYLPANSFAIVLNNTVIETDLPLNNFAKITLHFILINSHQRLLMLDF